MKRVLILLLGVFLIVDAFLALSLFKPSLFNTQFKHSISISPDSKLKAEIINESYLNKKLNEVGFWDTNNVNLFKINKGKVTVNHLAFELTDQPQYVGIKSDSNNAGEIIHSYGQKYNHVSKTMTIIAHINKRYHRQDTISQNFSKLVLYIIFDATQTYPRKSISEFDRELKKFMEDYRKNPSSNNFVRVTQL